LGIQAGDADRRFSIQSVSKPFAELAKVLAERLDGPEVTVGLRKLLEAKDCMVRAALALPAE